MAPQEPYDLDGLRRFVHEHTGLRPVGTRTTKLGKAGKILWFCMENPAAIADAFESLLHEFLHWQFATPAQRRKPNSGILRSHWKQEQAILHFEHALVDEAGVRLHIIGARIPTTAQLDAAQLDELCTQHVPAWMRTYLLRLLKGG